MNNKKLLPILLAMAFVASCMDVLAMSPRLKALELKRFKPIIVEAKSPKSATRQSPGLGTSRSELLQPIQLSIEQPKQSNSPYNSLGPSISIYQAIILFDKEVAVSGSTIAYGRLEYILLQDSIKNAFYTKPSSELPALMYSLACNFPSAYYAMLTLIEKNVALECHLLAQDERGWTILHWAVCQGQTCIIPELLTVAEKIGKLSELLTVEDLSGYTGLMVAQLYGCRSLEDILSKAMDRVYAIDELRDIVAQCKPLTSRRVCGKIPIY